MIYFKLFQNKAKVIFQKANISNNSQRKANHKGDNMPESKIANTIAKQIGNQAFTMIGAKNLLAHESALSFRIGKNVRKVNYVKVTLNGLDLYDIEYGCIWGSNYKVRATDENIYFDGLHASIEANTGMFTKLF